MLTRTARYRQDFEVTHKAGGMNLSPMRGYISEKLRDILVMENFILLKEEQRPLENDENWRETYELD